MRKTFTVGMLLAFVAACGTTPAESNAADAPAASAPATATGAAAATGTTTDAGAAADATATATAAADTNSPPALGTAQLIKTERFTATVTVKAATVAAEIGDAPYGIDVHVELTEGAWGYGVSPVQLVYANGSAHDPIEHADTIEGSPDLDAPNSFDWRLFYDHPAGAGVGQGARVTISSNDGKPLATWLT
ncbi:hypothetical protein [Actinoplanes sp. NBRC 101535]|uniref:hypothetical protein n=1 Tax=Actinoplanes sp. NBRC 101535 TaxID=3032196 RepID=UPI0024A3A11E|nr:hypothetical protein [Actinoplanes sp. NBRC 101535]GLY07101.1 hypothetical protein Acsp01_74800 [Actinoplanes sp. NBRC 101535]